MTDLQIILQVIRQIKPLLTEQYHVNSIGLFGSVVRADFTQASDVDIIVNFNQPIGIEFVDLAEFLEKKIKKKIDLVSRNGIKEKYFKMIESEIIYV